MQIAGNEKNTHVSKYLEVIFQSDLKFTHIKQKVAWAKQQLDTIMAPPKKPSRLRTQLRAIRTLNMRCQYKTMSSSTKFMILKWVSTVPSGLYVNWKGWASISAALNALELDNLNEHRNIGRHDLLLAILPNENCHKTIPYSHDELMDTRPPYMSVTRAISKGDPQTIHAKSLAYLLSQQLSAPYSTRNENKSLNNIIYHQSIW